jgi:hypothetical protein
MPTRRTPFSHTQPFHYLKRLDGGNAVIDVRHLDPRKTWRGVPVREAVLGKNPPIRTDVFAVNLHLYSGIWICSCWIEGKPGYHKHPLLGDDWPEWLTFWEVTGAQARKWCDDNHQPIPDELKGVASVDPPGRPATPSQESTGTSNEAKGTPDTPERLNGQALTQDEKKLYKRIVRELKKQLHGSTGKKTKVADKLGIDIKLVVRADKWGRRHGLL